MSKWLEKTSLIQSVAIFGSPIELLAETVRSSLPRAQMFLIAQNAKDLDAFPDADRNHASIAIGVDFDPIDGPVEMAILRVSGFEGKNTLSSRLESAKHRIQEGGTAVVLTHTKRGARTQLAMLHSVFGNGEVVERGGGGFRVLIAKVTGDSSDRNATTQFVETRISEEILGERFEFITPPAVFSRERIDVGTRLLLETLSEPSPRKILDFGCGYGVMGIVLARRFPSSRIVMVDVDVAAVAAARENAVLNKVDDRTRAVLSDGLKQIPEERFDLAVTHFPLHIGRDELNRLLIEIRNALEPGGRLYGVMLNAYELRPLVERVFGNVDTVPVNARTKEEGEYSILRASRT